VGIDRVGRSPIDLVSTIQHLELPVWISTSTSRTSMTTTPMGRLLFQVTGAFAEFERSMIQQRVQVGLNSIKARSAKDGKFETKAGIMRSRLGRPGAEPKQLEQAKQMLAEGKGIIRTAKDCGLGNSTVHNLKRKMLAAAAR
jgi:DNA invertase Pin-like site-specific DNA recombinase